MNKLDIFFIIVLLTTLIALLFLLYRQKYLPYARQKQLLQIAKEVSALYTGINPFQVSLEARKDYANLNKEELVYGEIEIVTLFALLEKIHPKPHNVFYDLGSGSGRALIATKLAYPTLTVKGIEVLAALHHLASDRWDALQQKSRQRLNASSIDFICGNFLEQNFLDADIILVNATSFSPETWQKLILKFENLKKGCKIVVISKQLPETLFKSLYMGSELMSWGFTTTRIYEKM